MANVSSSDLDDDHWATSGGVRDHIDIPQKGNETDLEAWIISATTTVQAWWKEATDGDMPEDLPPTDNQNPNQIEKENALLVKATELLAASEAHESKAQDIRASDEGEDKKHIYLEKRAKSKFEDWVMVNGYGETDTTQQESSSLGSGRSSSLVDLG